MIHVLPDGQCVSSSFWNSGVRARACCGEWAVGFGGCAMGSEPTNEPEAFFAMSHCPKLLPYFLVFGCL